MFDKLSPYKLNGTGEGSGVLVFEPGVLVDGLGEFVGWGVESCSDEQDKRRNANAVTKRDARILTLRKILISLLLALAKVIF